MKNGKSNIKVIIPVAGIGRKLRPQTNNQPKALVPVAGKPILSHIVDNLTEDGIKNFVFIIGYFGDRIEKFIRQKYPDINANFIVQTEREGVAHAVWLAKDFIEKKDELLIVLGDTIFDIDLKSVLKLHHSSLGVKRVEDPRNFGVAELSSDGFIKTLLEKPNIPTSNLALVGVYRIKEAELLMECIDYLIKNNLRTQNDFHLTDALMRMIDLGAKINSFPVENWFDCGSKASLLETNSVLLKRFGPSKNTDFETLNSIIIQPVRIAQGCKLENAIIGPNVSIGENTTIKSSVLKNCIIGSFSQIENKLLHNSVVGNDASLKGASQSLNIGDNTEIDFT